MGEVRLEGRWQVSRLTKIDTGMGSVTIDLSQAEFDDWDVEIVVHTHMGEITVIVPRGLEVRPGGPERRGQYRLEPPIPGFPVVRLSATCDMGTIRVMHPAEKKQRRREDGPGDVAKRHPGHEPTAANSAAHGQGHSSWCG